MHLSPYLGLSSAAVNHPPTGMRVISLNDPEGWRVAQGVKNAFKLSRFGNVSNHNCRMAAIAFVEKRMNLEKTLNV